MIMTRIVTISLFFLFSLSMAQMVVREGAEEIMRCTEEKLVGIGTTQPRGALEVHHSPVTKTGIWPTVTGTPRNGHANLVLPIESYQNNELAFGLSSYLPIFSSTQQSSRGVSSIVFKEINSENVGIASGVLGKVDGSQSYYQAFSSESSIIGASGQIYDTFDDALTTVGGFFVNERSDVDSAEEPHYGIYVDAYRNRMTGTLDLGTGSQARGLYACGTPLQAVVVIGEDETTAIANCQRINAQIGNAQTVTTAHRLPISVNIN